MSRATSAYAKAGVNIDTMMQALSRAKRSIQSTSTPGVVSDVGSFGGLYRIPGSDQLLVSSIDGVGTKLNVASMAGIHTTIGEDLVNHCVNDILCQGARPLFFLDYLGAGKLDPAVFSDVVAGIARGCRRNGCALIGGETAEMPGLYPGEEYDLVGSIVGIVERKKLITGKRIRKGDLLVGLLSSGLHTNGYTLARSIVFKQARLKIDDTFPGTRRSVAQVLLAVHKSYLRPVEFVRKKVELRGIAHITGGGLIDNLPRILPEGLQAIIHPSAWREPPVFRFLREAGAMDPMELYRVFNMGIGLVLVIRPGDEEQTLSRLKQAGQPGRVIGQIESGSEGVRFAE